MCGLATNTLRHSSRAGALVLSAISLFSSTLSPRAASAGTTIPLCPGLTIATAISDPEGDYETIKTIQSVDDKTVSLKVSTQRRIQSVVRNITVNRTVLRSDLKSATLYMHWFNTFAPLRIPGSTALGISSDVLRALKSNGAAELGIVDAGNSGLRADRNVHPNVYDFRMNYELQRVGSGSVTVPVTVNDARVELPAIQAQGEYIGDKAEFVFLDDENNPLTLEYHLSTTASETADAEGLRLQVVKISYRCSDPLTPQPSGASRLERALLETGRAEVYDIYFNFDSDQIREESEPTLREIDELMRRHPDWKLTIEGHTDSIASDSYNLDLSRRRAAAVKSALVKSHGVAEARLSASGFGESRPKDRNDTLEGRARNRRVELVRQQ